MWQPFCLLQHCFLQQKWYLVLTLTPGSKNIAYILGLGVAAERVLRILILHQVEKYIIYPGIWFMQKWYSVLTLTPGSKYSIWVGCCCRKGIKDLKFTPGRKIYHISWYLVYCRNGVKNLILHQLAKNIAGRNGLAGHWSTQHNLGLHCWVLSVECFLSQILEYYN